VDDDDAAGLAEDVTDEEGDEVAGPEEDEVVDDALPLDDPERRTLAKVDNRGKPNPSMPEICCDASVRFVELIKPASGKCQWAHTDDHVIADRMYRRILSACST
jgi:hypothetical protein